MANFTIETTRMSPGAVLDCKQKDCQPSIGGVCAYVPDTPVWWCCPPYASNCWSEPQMCDYNNDDTVSSGQIRCSAAGRAWCCKNGYEECGPGQRVNVCVPRGLVNPAKGGPIWGPDAVGGSSAAVATPTLTFTVIMPEGTTPTPTTPMPTQTAVGKGGSGGLFMPVALAVGAVGVVGVVGAAAYWLWRRRRRGVVPDAGPSMARAEMDGETVWKQEVAEIPAVYPQEMEGGGVIHEM